jgi:hypothetical protein
MSPIRGRWSRWRPTAVGQLLVDETEQFLSGGYAGNLLAIGAPVPAWAWLGLLAHTPEDELEARAEAVLDMGRNDTASVLWQGAVALLVEEIVHTSKQIGCTVGDLQEAWLSSWRPGPGALRRPWTWSPVGSFRTCARYSPAVEGVGMNDSPVRLARSRVRAPS